MTKNIFFTSDTHFFHTNIIRYCPDSRGHFNDATEMNECLIERWNNVVNDNDVVYHLGDVGFARGSLIKNVFDRLKGKVILIPGNHDKKLLKQKEFVECFDKVSCAPYSEEKIDGNFIVMSHYPIARWNRMYFGVSHLHGHCHSSFGYHQKALDVGVDARPKNDLTPWEWSELKTYMANRQDYTIRNVAIDDMIST